MNKRRIRAAARQERAPPVAPHRDATVNSRLMASRQGMFSSSVGTKILIGITGLLLFFYLLIHIAGNLVVFLGPAAFNKYAFTLESNPLLPLVRHPDHQCGHNDRCNDDPHNDLTDG